MLHYLDLREIGKAKARMNHADLNSKPFRRYSRWKKKLSGMCWICKKNSVSSVRTIWCATRPRAISGDAIMDLKKPGAADHDVLVHSHNASKTTPSEQVQYVHLISRIAKTRRKNLTWMRENWREKASLSRRAIRLVCDRDAPSFVASWRGLWDRPHQDCSASSAQMVSGGAYIEKIIMLGCVCETSCCTACLLSLSIGDVAWLIAKLI